MNETFIGSDLIQYGFAGFAFLLAGIIFLLIKEWRKDAREAREDVKELTKETHDIVTKNTAAFVGHQESLNRLRETLKENTEVLRRMNGRK